jgi:alpha-beta hydrolase superfamily lysophospholipase
MLEAIPTRELITLDGIGIPIRGTYHRPSDSPTGPLAYRTGRKRPGVLFLNSLSLPRAATGDSAVHWADSCAERGYPTYRFDLPGLGDSEGDLCTDLLDFINGGGYTNIAAAKVKELVEREGLSGVIIVGHCAGAVSALYAAAATKECRGLIMMDPYFHLPQMIRPKLRQKLSDWARSNRIGGLLSDFYDRCRDLVLFVRSGRAPGNANFTLLNCWKQTSATGMPILMLKAPGLKTTGTQPRAGQFDYLKYVVNLAGNKNQVTVNLIEDTDHSFANRSGRAAVRQQIEKWLDQYFPLEGLGESSRGVALAVNGRDDKNDYSKHRRVSTSISCAVEGR